MIRILALVLCVGDRHVDEVHSTIRIDRILRALPATPVHPITLDVARVVADDLCLILGGIDVRSLGEAGLALDQILTNGAVFLNPPKTMLALTNHGEDLLIDVHKTERVAVRVHETRVAGQLWVARIHGARSLPTEVIKRVRARIVVEVEGPGLSSTSTRRCRTCQRDWHPDGH